jgi:hypothetical protein
MCRPSHWPGDPFKQRDDRWRDLIGKQHKREANLPVGLAAAHGSPASNIIETSRLAKSSGKRDAGESLQVNAG